MIRWATWMFFGPSSRAIDCATARSPNLAPAKAAKPLPPRKLAVAPVKKMLPLPRGSINRADSRPATKPAQQAISQTLRNTRSVVSRIGKLTLAPMLKMHTSSGACLSASPKKEMISSSLRASSERAWISPPAASISFTSGSSLAPLRRPANTVKPSEANFLAISPPIKSPAPITATVPFLFCKGVLPVRSNLSVTKAWLTPCRSSALQGLRELVLEDLAGRGGRQRVQHDDLRRPLVRGELRVDESHQIGRLHG